MDTSDRRTSITACAITLVAEKGARSLTHRGIDERLALPKGSTSYYFRTREALVEATAHLITVNSRESFERLQESGQDPITLVSSYLTELLHLRRDELIARYALLVETRENTQTHEALASCLFSREGALQLTRSFGASEPESAAFDLLGLLEGLIFDRTVGIRSRVRRSAGTEARELHTSIGRFLHGLAAAHRT